MELQINQFWIEAWCIEYFLRNTGLKIQNFTKNVGAH